MAYARELLEPVALPGALTNTDIGRITTSKLRIRRSSSSNSRFRSTDIFLGRAPNERADQGLRAFYGTLIRAAGDAELRDGIWQLCDGAAPDQPTLLAWTWTMNDRRRIIVVNFADEPAHGRVPLPWHDLAGHTWRLEDALAGNCFKREGRALADEGLQVQLTAWGTDLLSLHRRPF